MYHSFTSYKLFSDCPYAWWARYVGKTEVKRPDSPALIRGREMHEFYERAVMDGTWRNEIAKIPPRIYSELEKVHGDGAVVKTELTIYFDFNLEIIKKDWNNAHGVVAKIDLLSVGKNGVYIGDYKTGKSDGSDEQLYLYALPLAGSCTCSFLYVDRDDVKTIETTKEKEMEFWEKFKAYAGVSEGSDMSEGRYERVVNRNCRWCCVRGCPYAQGLADIAGKELFNNG